MNKSTVVLLSLALAGCASVTEPMKIASDTYLVNSQASGSFYSWGEVKNLALAKANSHCDQQGKVIELVGEEYSGVRSVVPIEVHIKYRCVGR